LKVKGSGGHGRKILWTWIIGVGNPNNFQRVKLLNFLKEFRIRFGTKGLTGLERGKRVGKRKPGGRSREVGKKETLGKKPKFLTLPNSIFREKARLIREGQILNGGWTGTCAFFWPLHWRPFGERFGGLEL